MQLFHVTYSPFILPFDFDFLLFINPVRFSDENPFIHSFFAVIMTVTELHGFVNMTTLKLFLVFFRIRRKMLRSVNDLFDIF